MEDYLKIRVPKELKEKLQAQADALNISLSAYVRMVLTKAEE